LLERLTTDFFCRHLGFVGGLKPSSACLRKGLLAADNSASEINSAGRPWRARPSSPPRAFLDRLAIPCDGPAILHRIPSKAVESLGASILSFHFPIFSLVSDCSRALELERRGCAR